ncbi:ABC transporter permease [Streptomyces sp. NPDC002346]
MSETVTVRPPRPRGLIRVREGGQIWMVLAALALVILVFRPSMLNPAGIQGLMRDVSVLGLLCIGQATVMVGGGIDLSVAAVTRVASVVGALYFASAGAVTTLGCLIVLLVATGLGVVNGLLIGLLRLPPFITTFAVLLILDGLTLSLAASAVGSAPPALIDAYSQAPAGLPLPFFTLVAVLIVLLFVLSRSAWGKSVVAVGTNPVLAGHAGVRVVLVRISLYVVNGVVSGLAALVLLSRSGVGDPLAIQGMEMLTVTAAVIGGVSLAGGRGGPVGALGGAIFLTLLTELLSEFGVDSRYQVLVQGLIILAALASYRRPRAARD